MVEKKLKEIRGETVDSYLKKIDEPRLLAAKERMNQSSELTPAKKKPLLVYFIFMEKVRELILNKITTVSQIYKAFSSKFNPADNSSEEL